jgi:hypothetical protein
MKAEQIQWITAQSIPELARSFATLLEQGKVARSDWSEWAKVWSKGNTPSMKERAFEVFKD